MTRIPGRFVLAALFAGQALAVLLSGPGLAQPRPATALTRALVGVWQAAPSIGAGWAQTHRFFPNGRYHYHASQFDCATREREREGRWRLEGERLVLDIDGMTVVEGGRLEPALGSCGSAREIVGGRTVHRIYEVTVRSTLALRLVGRDPTNGRTAITLAGRRFWKFADDPAAYP